MELGSIEQKDSFTLIQIEINTNCLISCNHHNNNVINSLILQYPFIMPILIS